MSRRPHSDLLMMELMSEEPGPPRTPAEQRRLVAHGCQVGGGCLGMILLLFVLHYVGEFFLRRLSVSPPGENIIIFANFSRVRNEMLGGTIFAFVAMLAIPAFVKNLRACRVVMIAAAGACFIMAWMTWYRPFAALAFEAPHTIELQYLWPRPNQKIDAATVVSFDRKTLLIPSMGTPVEVHELIFVTSDGATHRSLDTRIESQLDAAKTAIERMKATPR